MAKKDSNQHIAILQDIRKKLFKPVYLLMGDESYYIDLICDAIIANALREEERGTRMPARTLFRATRTAEKSETLTTKATAISKKTR